MRHLKHKGVFGEIPSGLGACDFFACVGVDNYLVNAVADPHDAGRWLLRAIGFRHENPAARIVRERPSDSSVGERSVG